MRAVAQYEALIDDAVDKAHVDVAAGEQAHGLASGGLDLAAERRGEAGRAGGLDDQLAALHEQQYGRGNLVVADRDHVVDVLEYLGDGLLARVADRDAVGYRGDAVCGDVLTGLEALVDGARAFGLAPTTFTARVDLLDAGRDAADQPAAADRHQHGVHCGQLAEYFERHGALTGHDLVVVEGVQEGAPSCSQISMAFA